jgi:chromosome segregation ATPase
MRDFNEILAFLTDEEKGIPEEEYEILRRGIIQNFIDNNPEMFVVDENSEPDIVGGDPDEVEIIENKNGKLEVLTATENSENKSDEKKTKTEKPPTVMEKPKSKKQKRGFFLNAMKDYYRKEIRKAETKIDNVKKQIKGIKQEIENSEELLTRLLNQHQQINSEIIGLVNASSYLEDNDEGGLVGLFLRLTARSNQKRIYELQSQQESLKIKADKTQKRITELLENIAFLESEVGGKQKDVDVIKVKADNLEKIKGFVNPLAGLIINALSETKIADLEKYMYREISEAELAKLENYQFSKRKSKNNGYIIRFERAERDVFENLLTA